MDWLDLINMQFGLNKIQEDALNETLKEKK